MKIINKLTKEELKMVRDFIGPKPRPIKNAKKLFPDHTGKGTVKNVTRLYQYCHYKYLYSVTELEYFKEMYESYFDILPDYIKQIDIGKIESN